MTLEWASIPLAGVAGVLSPCVWPLVPVVMSSAAGESRRGPWMLAAGLSLSFALAGTLLSFLLVSAGLDPELFRDLAGAMLVGLAAVLLIRPLGDALSRRLSALSSRLEGGASTAPASAWGQFGVGSLLGLVWLPCVGPTLGAAIGLASMGQSLGLAFVTMLAYGLGTAAVLLAAGIASQRVLVRWRPGILATANRGKMLLGWLLLALGTLVLTGLDKRLEALALPFLPEWIVSI